MCSRGRLWSLENKFLKDCFNFDRMDVCECKCLNYISMLLVIFVWFLWWEPFSEGGLPRKSSSWCNLYSITKKFTTLYPKKWNWYLVTKPVRTVLIVVLYILLVWPSTFVRKYANVIKAFLRLNPSKLSLNWIAS